MGHKIYGFLSVLTIIYKKRGNPPLKSYVYYDRFLAKKKGVFYMNEGKVLTMSQLTGKVNLTAPRIYERIKAGTFPAGTKYGHARVWNEAEIETWLAQRNQSVA